MANEDLKAACHFLFLFFFFPNGMSRETVACRGRSGVMSATPPTLQFNGGLLESRPRLEAASFIKVSAGELHLRPCF